jgi:hypothetical protein
MLLVIALLQPDAGDTANGRVCAVGADQQLRRNRVVPGQHHDNPARFHIESLDPARTQPGHTGTLRECTEKAGLDTPVLDYVAQIRRTEIRAIEM